MAYKQHMFIVSHSPRGWKIQDQGQADSVSDEGPAHFLVHRQHLLFVSSHGGSVRELSKVLVSHQASTLMTYALPKVSPPNTITLRIRTSTYELEVGYGATVYRRVVSFFQRHNLIKIVKRARFLFSGL